MVSALLRRFEQQWSVQSDELRPFASVDSGRSKRELDQSAYKHPRGFFCVIIAVWIGSFGVVVLCPPTKTRIVAPTLATLKPRSRPRNSVTIWLA
jgi:hypothetical protein